MSRPAPELTPDQRAALDRAKKPRVHPFRMQYPTSAQVKADVARNERVLPRLERLVRG